MITSKELTIEELFDEYFKLKKRLIEINNKRAKLLINVTAINWKDIMVKGGNKGDAMTNKIIKIDETETEFDVVKESFISYKNVIEEKLVEMIRTKPIGECIAYFRDDLKWKWNPICNLFDYSRSQAHKLYDDFKKK